MLHLVCNTLKIGSNIINKEGKCSAKTYTLKPRILYYLQLGTSLVKPSKYPGCLDLYLYENFIDILVLNLNLVFTILCYHEVNQNSEKHQENTH